MKYAILGDVHANLTALDAVLDAVDPLRGRRVRVRVVSPHMIDPEGERLRA